MMKKGRANPAIGERQTTSKLKEAQVLEIRRRNAAGESMGALGRSFGITVGHIHGIIHRKRWKHL
jgi:hypothetical protein